MAANSLMPVLVKVLSLGKPERKSERRLRKGMVPHTIVALYQNSPEPTCHTLPAFSISKSLEHITPSPAALPAADAACTS